MSPSTHEDAWLFADAEAWNEFGEAYAAEFDGDLVVVDESVPLPRSGGPQPNGRDREILRPGAQRFVLSPGG